MNLPHIRSMGVLEAIWHGDGMAKHGDDGWTTRADHIDAAASERHGRAHNIAVGFLVLDDHDLPLTDTATLTDRDSGLPHLGHRIIRDLCRLERLLREQDARNGD